MNSEINNFSLSKSLLNIQFYRFFRVSRGGHDGRMQLRDVWASSDGGCSWTQVCQSAQWEGRQGHATVCLDGHVYLMGGFGGASRFNDLWKSSDCGELNYNWSIN